VICAATGSASRATFAPHWVEPDAVEFRAGPFDSLEIVYPDGGVVRSVFAVQCFPATQTNDYISVRTWDRDGHERELGIARKLGSWSARNQKLVREALARRYFLRRITGVDGIKLECGYLRFDVRTDHGPTQFTTCWTQSRVQDFGARGKVLLDVEDNRFLLPDVDDLPDRDREVFERHVYW
jgi:ATP-binding cassette, subfamily B, bacterial